MTQLEKTFVVLHPPQELIIKSLETLPVLPCETTLLALAPGSDVPTEIKKGIEFQHVQDRTGLWYNILALTYNPSAQRFMIYSREREQQVLEQHQQNDDHIHFLLEMDYPALRFHTQHRQGFSAFKSHVLQQLREHKYKVEDFHLAFSSQKRDCAEYFLALSHKKTRALELKIDAASAKSEADRLYEWFSNLTP